MTSTRSLYVAEPAATWASPPVVVDCSAMAALLFAEPEADAASAALSGKSLHAPSLLPYEMASVARKKLRGGAAPHDVEAALTQFANQRFNWHTAPLPAILALALRYQLSTYDAAYLWLATELQSPLVTLDQRLAEAAHRHLNTLE